MRAVQVLRLSDWIEFEHDLGFPPAMARLIFIIGRVAGLTAQVMEEHTREEPMRIHISVTYDGVPPKQL